ncbi:MAG TPA: hypothetical protein VJ180_13895, partial [Pyrinomonadaceae bacterium]|nr:hypothetical protein [Pyrinomonadaceae bacterium]
MLTIISVAIQLPLAAGAQKTDAKASPNDELDKLFAYDQSTTFDLRQESTKELGGAVIEDVTYAAQTH